MQNIILGQHTTQAIAESMEACAGSYKTALALAHAHVENVTVLLAEGSVQDFTEEDCALLDVLMEQVARLQAEAKFCT